MYIAEQKILKSVKVIPGPAGLIYAQELADKLNAELIIPRFQVYPDGETAIQLPTNLDGRIIVVQSCYYPQDSNFFQLLNLIFTIKDLGDNEIEVFIPYMCYARADRRVLEGMAITIQTVFHLLHAVQVKHLITLDIHNPEVLGVAKFKTTNVYPSKSIKSYLLENGIDIANIQIVAPDKGAIDRAQKLANELDVSYTSLDKYRDPISGNVSIQIGNAELNSSEVIMVDDIMSTGGTLVKASNLLVLNGVNKIHYVITHAMGTDAVDKLREIGNGLVVATNSTNTIIGKISPIDDIIQVI